MEPVFAILVGLFFAAAVYLLLSKSIIRMLLGVAILGNAVNLLIFTSGRLSATAPPILDAVANASKTPLANPLPQALILTAIVISFSFFAFLLVLSWRAYQTLATDRTDGMRLAEPDGDLPPPMGY